MLSLVFRFYSVKFFYSIKTAESCLPGTVWTAGWFYGSAAGSAPRLDSWFHTVLEEETSPEQQVRYLPEPEPASLLIGFPLVRLRSQNRTETTSAEPWGRIQRAVVEGGRTSEPPRPRTSAAPGWDPVYVNLEAILHVCLLQNQTEPGRIYVAKNKIKNKFNVLKIRFMKMNLVKIKMNSPKCGSVKIIC